jgi:hypothetical protein
MFFRRGRLSARRARALLVELFDHHYQWPLRLPIIQLLQRGDPLRFLCTIRFLVDWMGDGIFLLNQRQPPTQTLWFDDDAEAALAGLGRYPTDVVERLTAVMRLDDPVVAEGIVWRLPGSRLAALTGSVAAGYADVTSDIDISLFGLKLPEADVRRSLIAATSSAPDDITQLTAKTHAADAFWLAEDTDGQRLYLVDVHYFLLEEAQRLIEHPVPTSRPDEELLAALSTADVLVDYESRGPDLLSDLRQATRQARPQRMASALTELEQSLARLEGSTHGSGMFYATTDAILALFQLLAARNDRWIVFPKRTVAWLSGLEHVPRDLHERLSPVALLPFRSENLAVKLETLRTLESEIRTL